jgi:hypothetical protein
MRECLRQLGFFAIPKMAEKVWSGAHWSRESFSALLVDRQHHRAGRRIELEADDISHLLGKPWIA